MTSPRLLPLLLLTLAGLAAGCSDDQPTVIPGEALAADAPDLVPPDVVLPVVGGDDYLALSDLRGRKLIVHFFASWCPECRKRLIDWQQASSDLGDDLLTVVIAQEQHPERSRLFLDWQGIDALLLADPLDLHEVPYVPITLLVDEQGWARHAPAAARAEEGLAWLQAERRRRPPVRLPEADVAALTDVEALYAEASTDGATAEDWRRYAQALFLARDPGLLTSAIDAWETLLELDPRDPNGFLHFRLGTAYRARYDSEHRRPGDFRAAVGHWHQALRRNPDNWLFHRRLQQYGPTLDKPHAFYDWLPQARQQLAAQGRPVPDAALDPTELAPPRTMPPEEALEAPEGPAFSRADQAARAAFIEPDPEGSYLLDRQERVALDSLLVPPTVPPGGTVRVRLELAPAEGVVWNPGAPAVVVWMPAPLPWRTAPPLHVFPELPERPDAARVVDLELRAPENAERGVAALPGYVLYSVCTAAPPASPEPPPLTWQTVGRIGGCADLRQPLPVEVPVVPGVPQLERRALP